jgi:hypothetical protein
MRGQRLRCGEQFGEQDAGEDQRCSGERAMTEAFVKEEEGDEPGEYGLEGEQESGMSGRKMLLGPALDGEGCRGGEEAGNGERDYEARSEIEVDGASEREREKHQSGGEHDLEGG